MIPAPTVNSIYEVPLKFHQYHITELIADHLRIDDHKNLRSTSGNRWLKINSKLPEVKIAMVGKYTALRTLI